MIVKKKRTGQAQFVAVALSRTAVIRSSEMLHDARMAAMTGRAAALSGMVELPIWADNANITLGADSGRSLQARANPVAAMEADIQMISKSGVVLHRHRSA
jgi:hypothetical protein